jgi:hypothetical protein
MPTFVVVIIIILLISITVLLAVTYLGDQAMTCPHCGLAFVADLFLVGKTALLSCPFCRRWILVTKARNRFEVEKILG